MGCAVICDTFSENVFLPLLAHIYIKQNQLEYLSGLAAGESTESGGVASMQKKKHSFTNAFRRPSSFQPTAVKRNYVRPVSFTELSKRAAAPPRRGILLGYIKASWDGSGRGELVTVFNPKAKVN
jgi:hypothetical protein